MILSTNFWTVRGFKQRLTNKQWRQVLLDKQDEIFVNGCLRQLIAKRLGAGVVEVSMKPEKDEKR